MALEDILERIERDSREEAERILAEARASADAAVAEARRLADKEAAAVAAAAEKRAANGAATLLANARLRARDLTLTARHDLIAETLAAVEERILALPDDEYAALIAAGVRTVCRGGETVRIGAADADRLGRLLPALLADLDVGFAVADDAGARGVVLAGDRVSAEVTPASLVAASRERLVDVAASVLFPDDGRD